MLARPLGIDEAVHVWYLGGCMHARACDCACVRAAAGARQREPKMEMPD